MSGHHKFARKRPCLRLGLNEQWAQMISDGAFSFFQYFVLQDISSKRYRYRENTQQI